MRRYKLLKDLPNDKVGTIRDVDTWTELYNLSRINVYDNPEWFEEIKEEPKKVEFKMLPDDSHDFSIYRLETTNLEGRDRVEKLQKLLQKLMEMDSEVISFYDWALTILVNYHGIANDRRRKADKVRTFNKDLLQLRKEYENE